MFGYVTIDKPNMFVKDYYAYRSFYCGICVNMGKKYGQLKRFLTNYDVTFLSAFVHAYKDVDVEIKNTNCILNPLSKKPIMKSSPLMPRILNVTILLAYYKIKDNIQDEGNAKYKTLSRLLNKTIKKATKAEKEIATTIDESITLLTHYENKDDISFDELCHPFATMLGKIALNLCDTTDENVYDLFYNLGRWVYIIDAIDDLEKDFTNKTFNPLINYYKDYTDKQSFIEKHKEELTFLVNSAYNKIKYHYGFIKLNRYEGVVTNILWYGLLKNGNAILGGQTLTTTKFHKQIRQ